MNLSRPERTDTPQKDVVGAMIEHGGLVLVAQRKCADLNGKWEFPGGKVEPGETHSEALKREIAEELGVEIEVGSLVGTNTFSVRHQVYQLHVYSAVILHGSPKSDEHSSITWVPIDELLAVDLAPADIPIAREALNHVGRNRRRSGR